MTQFVRIAVFIVVSLLAACAHPPVDEEALNAEKLERALQSAKVHTELAGEYFNRGQWDVALEEIDEALKAQPDYAPAYNVLGLVNMALNEDGKAMNNFEQAVRLAPKNAEIHNNYGWFLCQRLPERMDQAINYYLMAAKDPLYPTPEMAYTNAGLCELKRSRYDEARLFFHKALSIQSNYPSALIGLINVEFQRGNLSNARSKLTQFLQHNPSTPDGLLLALQIEQAAGDQRAADSYLFQLQKYFPDSKEAIAVREGRIR